MIYLGILLFLLACMALLDARFTLFVFAAPLRALLCLAAGTGFFVLWDVLAIERGIFVHKESELMTGIMVGEQFPLEEVFFLVFLCYCSMIAVAGTHRPGARSPRPSRGGRNDPKEPGNVS